MASSFFPPSQSNFLLLLLNSFLCPSPLRPLTTCLKTGKERAKALVAGTLTLDCRASAGLTLYFAELHFYIWYQSLVWNLAHFLRVCFSYLHSFFIYLFSIQYCKDSVLPSIFCNEARNDPCILFIFQSVLSTTLTSFPTQLFLSQPANLCRFCFYQGAEAKNRERERASGAIYFCATLLTGQKGGCLRL